MCLFFLEIINILKFMELSKEPQICTNKSRACFPFPCSSSITDLFLPRLKPFLPLFLFFFAHSSLLIFSFGEWKTIGPLNCRWLVGNWFLLRLLIMDCRRSPSFFPFLPFTLSSCFCVFFLVSISLIN